MRMFSPAFAARALWQMRVRRRPFVLSHGISSRCNLQCRFCRYWRKSKGEMSTPEILKMIDEASSFGIGVYNAWTVEPLLRPDLPEILKYAKGLGLVTSMVTNGKLLAKRSSELSDLDYLSVSLDGLESYRSLRGSAPDEVIKGVKAAMDEGHEVLINCVISRANLHELKDLVCLAEDLGAWISFEPIHQEEGISKEIWKELGIVDKASYKKAIDGLIKMKRKGAPIINSQTYLKMVMDQSSRFRCHASQIILHVASDGIIENCRARSKPLGYISHGLEKAWLAASDEMKKTRESCDGCLFFGYVENSLLYDIVPEVMAHYKWM